MDGAVVPAGSLHAPGEVEADTNLTENTIWPTALGKKNWLFVAREDGGERRAVISTIVESA